MSSGTGNAPVDKSTEGVVERSGRRKGRGAVLGVRMTAEIEHAVKMEAASRGISVADLFADIWKLYVASEKKEYPNE